MRKILGLTVAALLVMGLVGSGTWAFFSDTETSNANIFTAGTLDLTLDGNDDDISIFGTLGYIYPGDSDKAPGPYASLDSAGTTFGNLNIQFAAANNTEASGSSEFEGGGSGELGGYVQIAPWLDTGTPNGTFDAGTDIALKSDGTLSTAALQWDYVDNFGGDTFTNALTSFASANGTVRFYLPWDFVDNAGDQNDAQGDEANIQITFELKT